MLDEFGAELECFHMRTSEWWPDPKTPQLAIWHTCAIGLNHAKRLNGRDFAIAVFVPDMAPSPHQRSHSLVYFTGPESTATCFHM